jgi:hypothetical protein
MWHCYEPCINLLLVQRRIYSEALCCFIFMYGFILFAEKLGEVLSHHMSKILFWRLALAQT